MIKLIVFDAGGVLYTGSDKIVERAVRNFLKNHGVHDFDKSDRVWSTIEKLVSIGKISVREAHEQWLEGVGLSRDLLDQWMEVIKKEIWGKFRRTPGINELLRELRKKYILVVLSDTIDSKLEKIEKMDIVGVDHGIFDEIFTSHDLGAYKPSKKAFYAVLEKFGVRPSETVFISDACEELRGAKRIGLVTVGFKCSGGDHCIKRLDEIENILQNLREAV